MNEAALGAVNPSIVPHSCVVLIVEQSQSLGRIYEGFLEALVSNSTSIHHASTGRQALAATDTNRFDLIILDLGIEDIMGHALVRALRQSQPDAAIFALTVQNSLDLAVEAMRAGATDILIKPLNRDKFRCAIRQSPFLESLPRSPCKHAIASKKPPESSGADGFIGTSPAMRIIYKTITVAAPSDATVFITGDSGTGKELYAQAIHRRSKRANKAIISLNCSAIPRDLIESEIFGHVRGAFTGATEDRDGAAILADGGTLFLDEICEMDLELQSKLLRFIQTSTVKKVGDARAIKVDVRFICATNRNLLDEIASGRFREDLYYRLHVIPVHMPPLREREGDVSLLASKFLQRFANREGKIFSGFDNDTLVALEAHGWPGNVRQLENLIQNIVVMNAGGEVNKAMLPQTLFQSVEPNRSLLTHCSVHQPRTVVVNLPQRRSKSRVSPHAQPCLSSLQSQIRPLWLEERTIIEQAVKMCNGNTVLAAALLEVSPSTLYRKRKSWAQDQADAPALVSVVN